MKKHLPIAAVAAAALVLAGCAAGTSDDPNESPSPTVGAEGPDASERTDFGAVADVATLEAIAWEEDANGIPSLTVDTPSTVSGTATRLVSEPEGELVESGQVIKVDYTITSGTDGSELYSTYDAQTPEAILVSESTLDPVLYHALTNASEGTDMIFATMDQTAPDNPNAAIYMAMTISEVIQPLPRAEGEAVEPAEGLPAITLDDDGAPSVEFGDVEMPAELVVEPLIEGDGKPLELGDSVVAHYTGWLWDGEQFDSSWDRAEPSMFTFAEGQLIQGWTDGMAGQTVGSQVLLVIPPELGYGEQDREGIPAGSTLVFVIDILAAP